jgi:hypothetical protein
MKVKYKNIVVLQNFNEAVGKLNLSTEDFAVIGRLSKLSKKMNAKMEELRIRAEDAGKPYDDNDELEMDAYSKLKGRYERQYGRAFGAKDQKMPAATMPPMQGGQPAMQPAAQQPALGMQDLEPTYNADGTTAPSGDSKKTVAYEAKLIKRMFLKLRE